MSTLAQAAASSEVRMAAVRFVSPMQNFEHSQGMAETTPGEWRGRIGRLLRRMLPRVVVFVWMVEMLNLFLRVLNSLVAEGWNGAKKVEEGFVVSRSSSELVLGSGVGRSLWRMR